MAEHFDAGTHRVRLQTKTSGGVYQTANRYIDGANRVRLDVLNYQTNWEMPVQLCTVLEDLTTPVQLHLGTPKHGTGFS